MKKWTILFRTAEILLVLIFTVTLYSKVSGIVDQWQQEKAMSHLKSTANELAAWYQTSTDDYESFMEYYLNIMKLSAMYLQEGRGENTQEELFRLKQMVGGGDIYITDREGRIQAGTAGREVWFDREEYKPLFGVTQEEGVRGPLTYLEWEYEGSADGDTASDTEQVSSGGEEAEAPVSFEETSSVTDSSAYEASDAVADSPDAGQPSDAEKADEEDEEEDRSRLPWLYDILTSAWIDEDRVMVMRRSPQDFVASMDYSKDIAEVLAGASNDPDAQVLCYHNDGELMIRISREGEQNEVEWYETLEELRLPMAMTKTGFSGNVTLDGNQYNCVTYAIEETIMGSELMVAVLEPVDAMLPAKLFLMIGSFLTAIVTILLMSMYARALVAEEFKKIRRRDWDKGRGLRRKLFVVLLLGSLLTAVISIFVSILYVYASRAARVSEQVERLADDIEEHDNSIRTGSRNYKNYVQAVTLVSAGIISRHEGSLETSFLQQIADTAQAKRILVYGPGGIVTASNLNYTGIRIPSETNTPAGEFRWVLYGSPVLIQMEADTSFLEEPYYLSGSPIIDREENYAGLVQLAFSEQFFSSMVESGGIASIMEDYSSKKGFTYLAVNMETKEIISTEKNLNGLTFDTLGDPEVCLKDGFLGFMKLGHEAIIGCCLVANQNYAFVFCRTSGALFEGISCGAGIAVVCAAAEALAFLLLVLYAKICSLLSPMELKDNIKQIAGVLETEKRMLKLCSNALYVLAFLFVAFVLLSRFYFSRGTTPYYIFVHEWSNGLNIFSFLRCVTLLCTAMLALTIMTKLFTLAGTLLSSRQETVIRMAMSFLKYVVTIGALVLCAGMLGAPTSSLLAVSGVAALMFSMGSQSLVADIISGLFIIFEGTYKVGDMITVDDWHGQVVEIGIRNTKIRDLVASNVKIMNNSTIKNIINFSEYPSWCPIMIGIDYDQDIGEVERIFEQEKAIMRHNLPPVQSDIVFLGVDEFQDSCMLLKFQVQCRNQDFLKVKRALNREIKQMFDRHGITVPFPQVVLSSRQESPKTDEVFAKSGGEEEETEGLTKS